jgi:hypothetical protein
MSASAGAHAHARATHQTLDLTRAGRGILLFKILVESGTGGFFIPRLARLRRWERGREGEREREMERGREVNMRSRTVWGRARQRQTQGHRLRPTGTPGKARRAREQPQSDQRGLNPRPKHEPPRYRGKGHGVCFQAQ